MGTRPPITRRVAFVGLVLAMETRCTEPVAPAQEIASATGQVLLPVDAAPVVTLIDAGVEPRRAVRLRVPRGDVQAIRLQVETRLRMDSAIIALADIPLASLVLFVVMEPRVVAADGDIEVGLTIDRLIVDAAGSAENVLEGLGPVVGEVLVTSRGLVKRADLSFPLGIDGPTRRSLEALRVALTQWTVPFPDDPIGVNAAWTVTRTIRQQELTLVDSTRHDLIARDGDVLTVRMTSQQTAPPQRMPGSAHLPARARLLAFEGRGSSIFEVALTQFVPLRTTSSSQALMQVAVEAQGAHDAARVEVNVTIKGAAVPPPVTSPDGSDSTPYR